MCKISYVLEDVSLHEQKQQERNDCQEQKEAISTREQCGAI